MRLRKTTAWLLFHWYSYRPKLSHSVRADSFPVGQPVRILFQYGINLSSAVSVLSGVLNVHKTHCF